ncbi:hypothetical protein MNBD_GAMMA01-1338 [hydrothermal vent metagenome]|uniref:Uncharacterized protein n=1 Tax=hydrothermal vent metagenome TaxID=652676 RepID=A0A3B0VIW3_9ZZZZ
MNIVKQGETYASELALSGDNVSAFTYTMCVLQFPNDTPSISRTISLSDDKAQIALTSAETLALKVGQWAIHVQAADSDEDIRAVEYINIAKGWVPSGTAEISISLE